MIARTGEVLQDKTAAGLVLAVPVWDTVKRVDESGLLVEDIDRSGLMRIATPQCFPYGQLKAALAGNSDATDESSAMRSAGYAVGVVESSSRNIKLTRPQDIEDAKIYMENPMKIRVGIGYDSHRLVEGRKFILGGIEIDTPWGWTATAMPMRCCTPSRTPFWARPVWETSVRFSRTPTRNTKVPTAQSS